MPDTVQPGTTPAAPGRHTPESFYITTPIFYVNDAPHIGHAYTEAGTDILARWHRQRGDDTWMLTGTDEHGQKILRAAEAHGVTPQEWCDKLVEEAWKPLLDLVDVSNDDFIRTTDQRHVDRVQRFWQKLYDDGYVYKGSYQGWYSVSDEEFKPLNELVDGEGEFAGKKLTTSGKVCEFLEEENYFFRLSDFARPLLDYYEAHPDFIQPESARHEIVSFVSQGLEDLSISRSTFDWGIRIPWDEKHVLYVWIDALLNYLTAIGYPDDTASWQRRWPAVHIVGKDIIRFHAVIWPAMLLAAGLPLPEHVFGHGWLLVGGEKMSKSKANGIAPAEIIDTFGSDAFRYYFFRAITFGQDGSFSWEDLSARYQSELANGYGNLASRVAAMIGKYFDGVLPAPGPVTPAEEALVGVAEHAVADAEAAIDRLAVNEAVTSVWRLVDALNHYLTEQQPWQVAKGTDEASRARLATILTSAAEGLRVLAVTLNPVMPKSSAALWGMLGAEPALGPLADQRLDDVTRWGQLPEGTRVTKGPALFPRIDEDAVPAAHEH